MKNYQFMVIVHADKLHEEAKRWAADSDSFKKKNLIADILEQRIRVKAEEFRSEGKPVIFMGSQPPYLNMISGIS